MKKAILTLIILTSLAVSAGAAITWSGDVIPSDPSTWDSGTWGYIGYTGNGTMGITGGSDVLDGSGFIGKLSGSTGIVTVNGAGSTWTNNNTIHVGSKGEGTLNITGGGLVSSNGDYLGAGPGSTGTVTVDGAGSTWTNTALFVGESGNGTLSITGGGAVSNNWGLIGSEGGTGEVTVDGSGSVWTSSGHLHVGELSHGTLNITGGGLVSVAGGLTIDNDGGDDSFINMTTGGMLALLGDADESLVDFMGLIAGTDAIRYWDSSIADWANITGATYGLDYTLEYLTEGDLAGYTMLTVPEPVIPINLDIKPGSCFNPLNMQSDGILPAAVLGTEDLDVDDIDIASVRLAGVAPFRSNYQDITGPESAEPNACGCTTTCPDGYTDLTLKFRTLELAEELEEIYGQIVKGDELDLTLTGVLHDGSLIEGLDHITVVGEVPNRFNNPDLNNDGIVDFFDFAYMATHWLEETQ